MQVHLGREWVGDFYWSTSSWQLSVFIPTPVWLWLHVFLWLVQRQQRPTSSVTKSSTLRAQRRATVGKTRTLGSSVTSSKPVLFWHVRYRASGMFSPSDLCFCPGRSGMSTVVTCCALTSHLRRDWGSCRVDWPPSLWPDTALLWTAGQKRHCSVCG